MNKEKVYCENCEHFDNSIRMPLQWQCAIPKKTARYKNGIERNNPEEKNKNNDCSDFETRKSRVKEAIFEISIILVISMVITLGLALLVKL